MNIILETYDQTKAAKMERDQSLVENDSLLQVLVFSNPKEVLDYGVNSINMPMITSRVHAVKTLWFKGSIICNLFEQAQRAHSKSINGLVIFCHFEKNHVQTIRIFGSFHQVFTVCTLIKILDLRYLIDMM